MNEVGGHLAHSSSSLSVGLGVDVAGGGSGAPPLGGNFSSSRRTRRRPAAPGARPADAGATTAQGMVHAAGSGVGAGAILPVFFTFP